MIYCILRLKAHPRIHYACASITLLIWSSAKRTAEPLIYLSRPFPIRWTYLLRFAFWSENEGVLQRDALSGRPFSVSVEGCSNECTAARISTQPPPVNSHTSSCPFIWFDHEHGPFTVRLFDPCFSVTSCDLSCCQATLWLH